jgi:hypothetical protein
VEVVFSGEIWYWRGPSPFHFVAVPPDESAEIHALASVVTYGWGMIPVEGLIGRTRFSTSLFAKDGGYLLPVKSSVRVAEALEVGDVVSARLRLGPSRTS